MRSIDSRLRLACLLGIAIMFAPVTVAALDAETLTSQCAARDWGTYMNCQRSLLDIRAAGRYCVPQPENAARYQYEFLAFMRGDGARLYPAPAATAAAAYFDARYRCS